MDANSGDERARIAEWMDTFNTVLAGQQASEIASHRSALNDALDQMRL